MARQNFGFEKRQRELEKKKKKEQKLQRRQERKNPSADVGEPGCDGAGQGPADGGEGRDAD